jgi:type I restriction enzyme M protein
MAKKKARDELHRTIWQTVNDLQGNINDGNFKSCVLDRLIYRLASESLTASYISKEEQPACNNNFNYGNSSGKGAEFGKLGTVNEKGFSFLSSELFVNVCRKAKTDANPREIGLVFKNNKNSAKRSCSEHDLKALFDDRDLSSNKPGSSVQRNDRFIKIPGAISN